MNATVLKTIGIIAMTFDHIAVHLLESDMIAYVIFRGIGRFAFPIFALMIAEGFRHTRNQQRYFFRLLGFASLIEIFLIVMWVLFGMNYSLFPLGSTHAENVIWPLVFGLLALILWKKGTWWSWLLLLITLITPAFVIYPYGFYGVMMILIFGITTRKDIWLLGGTLLTAAYVLIPKLADPATFQTLSYLQLIAIPAIALFYVYNGKRGKGNRWFFYLYYPTHIGILVFLSTLF